MFNVRLNNFWKLPRDDALQAKETSHIVIQAEKIEKFLSSPNCRTVANWILAVFLSHDFSLWLFQAIPTGIKSHEIPISSSTQKTDAKKIFFWSLWCLSGAGCIGDIGSLYHLIITTRKSLHFSWHKKWFSFFHRVIYDDCAAVALFVIQTLWQRHRLTAPCLTRFSICNLFPTIQQKWHLCANKTFHSD